MSVRLLRFSLVGAALFIAVTVWAVQPPDPADDPLPKGAKVRFGVTRPILRTGPGVALLPGGYTNFVAPTMSGGIRRYDLGTGRPLDKRGIVGPGHVVVSADGKRAAVARPGAVTVMEVASGKELLAVVPPDGVIIAGTPGVSLSADGKVLAYGVLGLENRGEVVVCDVDKNEVLAQVETAQSAPGVPDSIAGWQDARHSRTAGAGPHADPGSQGAETAGDKPGRGPDSPGLGSGNRQGTLQGPRHRHGRHGRRSGTFR